MDPMSMDKEKDSGGCICQNLLYHKSSKWNITSKCGPVSAIKQTKINLRDKGMDNIKILASYKDLEANF